MKFQVKWVVSPKRWMIGATVGLWCFLSAASLDFVVADEDVAQAEANLRLVDIPEDPKTIDPMKILSEALAVRKSVVFDRVPYDQVVVWLEKNLTLPVVVDTPIEEFSSSRQQLVYSDRLDNEPIYWLLNRLGQIGINWYLLDDVIYLSSMDDEAEVYQTRTYDLTDLIDLGYRHSLVEEAIEQMVLPSTWSVDGGEGELYWLGDVLFVKQTFRGQWEVQCLVAALKDYGVKTWVFQPVEHESIRERLRKSIDFRASDIPLNEAIRRLRDELQVDIRFDREVLNQHSVLRQGVRLNISDRSGEMVLNLLLKRFYLTTTIQDGVVWIVEEDREKEHLMASIFDVRDLCINESESEALRQALQSQINADWDVNGGDSVIYFVRPGTMLLFSLDHVAEEIERMLSRYREVIRSSKPRRKTEEPELAIETRYYVLQKDLAKTTYGLLPSLVEPGSWKSEDAPDAAGERMLLPTQPTVTNVAQSTRSGSQEGNARVPIVVEQSVLIVTHSSKVQAEVQKLIGLLRDGSPRDAPHGGMMGGMGGGMMGGRASGSGGVGGGFGGFGGIPR